MTKIWSAVRRAVARTLDRTEMMLVANDLALAPAELAGLINGRPDTRGQMEDMAKRFGVTGRDIDTERWRAEEISKACGACSSAYSCQRFLDGKPTEFGAIDCPNAAHFKELSERNKHELAGLRA